MRLSSRDRKITLGSATMALVTQEIPHLQDFPEKACTLLDIVLTTLFGILLLIKSLSIVAGFITAATILVVSLLTGLMLGPIVQHFQVRAHKSYSMHNVSHQEVSVSFWRLEKRPHVSYYPD